MAKDPPPPGKRPRISGLASGPLPYLISLPERSIRSTGALAGGLAREVSEVVLPSSFRKTKLYRSLVDVTLRFVLEQVGRVHQSSDVEPSLPSDFALRKSAGNGIEMAGILLFRFSPVWVLAALSDLSSTGRVLVREISSSLVEKDLLEGDVGFTTIDEIRIDWPDGVRAYAGVVYSFHEVTLPTRISDSEWARRRPPDPAWLAPIVAHAKH